MNKDELIDLINDAGYCVMATVDGDKPKARPMMPYLTEDGNMLLAVLPNCRTIRQIKKNPNVELCYIDRKMNFARVSAQAKTSDDAQKKEIAWQNIPMLRQYFTGPNDKNFNLIEIEPTEVEVMTPQAQEPIKVSLK